MFSLHQAPLWKNWRKNQGRSPLQGHKANWKSPGDEDQGGGDADHASRGPYFSYRAKFYTPPPPHPWKDASRAQNHPKPPKTTSMTYAYKTREAVTTPQVASLHGLASNWAKICYKTLEKPPKGQMVPFSRGHLPPPPPLRNAFWPKNWGRGGGDIIISPGQMA